MNFSVLQSGHEAETHFVTHMLSILSHIFNAFCPNLVVHTLIIDIQCLLHYSPEICNNCELHGTTKVHHAKHQAEREVEVLDSSYRKETGMAYYLCLKHY